jgi:proteasome activator subunit 4
VRTIQSGERCKTDFRIATYANLDLLLRSFLSQLAETHVDPTVSNPRRVEKIPDDSISDAEGRPTWDRSDLETPREWNGLWKDVGIFSDVQWDMIMAKCLTSMG